MITGRCYCGLTRITARCAPQVITYCHCTDCRRASGAPVSVFAAFSSEDVTFEPSLGVPASAAPSAKRWFCSGCGSSVASQYDYLPGQIYVAVGLLDQAAELAPQGHAHFDQALSWLHVADDLPKTKGSARESLKR